MASGGQIHLKVLSQVTSSNLWVYCLRRSVVNILAEKGHGREYQHQPAHQRDYGETDWRDQDWKCAIKTFRLKKTLQAKLTRSCLHWEMTSAPWTRKVLTLQQNHGRLTCFCSSVLLVLRRNMARSWDTCYKDRFDKLGNNIKPSDGLEHIVSEFGRVQLPTRKMLLCYHKILPFKQKDCFMKRLLAQAHPSCCRWGLSAFNSIGEEQFVEFGMSQRSSLKPKYDKLVTGDVRYFNDSASGQVKRHDCDKAGRRTVK